VALTVSLLIGELLLRLLTPFPISESSNMRVHKDLLYTADPALPEIDPNGFRNPVPLLERYDVVAIGDSHTYGSNAKPSGAWPSQVAAATGLSTYNMGMGGYSIYQYDILFDLALDLQPRQIIVALYPANDWMPDCMLLALPSWRERIAREELNPPCAGSREGQATPQRLSVRQLIQRTAIGSALHVMVWEPIRYGRLTRIRGGGGGAGPELVLYEVGGHEFSFGMSRLVNHSVGTDLSLPRIASSYADGLKLYTRWRESADAARIHLAFAIIPSKERVLREWAVERRYAVPEELRRLTENELVATERLKSDLEGLEIPFVDALSSVVASFDRIVRDRRSMYPPGLDGHPYEMGYAAYAAAISSLISPEIAARSSR
jgi:hypothetical protein